MAGAGVSGRSAARALRGLGARVTLADDATGSDKATGSDDVTAVIAPGEAIGAIARYALVVTSPGWRPDSALLVAAADADVPVWGDVELAWRCDRSGVYGPQRRWLVVTGTNGKTTTTSMLESILQAAGTSSVACGNIGLPILDALASQPRAEVLAVELSSFQLHWAPSVIPEAGAVLNIAEDHLDWHGGMPAYTRAKAQVLRGRVGVLGVDDDAAAKLLDVSTAERTVGFRSGAPAEGEVGVRDGLLVDRAFCVPGGRRPGNAPGDAPGDAPGGGSVAGSGSGGDGGTVLIEASRIVPTGLAGTLDALAAATLARAIGTPAHAVAAGLDAHHVGPHRSALVGTIDGVDYIDDSKATNPHAALASIAGREQVVWIAGGLLKGASVDDLVAQVATKLTAVVLIGRDRAKIAAAMARHASDVPVTQVWAGQNAKVTNSRSTVPGPRPAAAADAPVADVQVGDDSQVMDAVVDVAARYARPGGTVLLAPAAASMDMFRNYAERGDSFAAAVAVRHSGGHAAR